MGFTLRTIALALALLAGPAQRDGPGGAAGPTRAPAPRDVSGRYAVHATAHLDATALPDRDGDAELDVVVSPGGAPGVVRLRATSRGYACELAARLGAGGALDLDPGQTCAVEVAEPDARGHVDARLRSARGRLAGGALDLDLAFDLSGSVSTHVSGRSLKVLGTEVALPEGWTPGVPLRGALTASAKGKRGGDAAAR